MTNSGVALTRRAFIGAGGVLGLGLILRRSAGETTPERGGTVTTQTIKPVHSDLIYQSYGVCTHPNFNTTPYGDTRAWGDRIGTIGIKRDEETLEPVRVALGVWVTVSSSYTWMVASGWR